MYDTELKGSLLGSHSNPQPLLSHVSALSLTITLTQWNVEMGIRKMILKGIHGVDLRCAREKWQLWKASYFIWNNTGTFKGVRTAQSYTESFDAILTTKVQCFLQICTVFVGWMILQTTLQSGISRGMAAPSVRGRQLRLLSAPSSRENLGAAPLTMKGRFTLWTHLGVSGSIYQCVCFSQESQHFSLNLSVFLGLMM